MRLRTLAPVLGLGASLIVLACSDPPEQTQPAESARASSDAIAPLLPPAGSASVAMAEAQPSAVLAPVLGCTKDMVLIAPGPELGAYCIDRYEASIVDMTTGQRASPYYPPEPKKARYLEKLWRDLKGSGTALERATPLPPLPAWQASSKFAPRGVSESGRVPAGYVSGQDATASCAAAGKRLCKRTEWKRACRGEQDRPFPYGDSYIQGRCNVFRESHPGILLYENPSKNHTDPRFNLVRGPNGPLLRITGGTLACKSVWGDDAIFDMVGNLDEWVDEPEGTFVGGFYARGRRDGCEAAIESHAFNYADYSTGFRCCGEPREMVQMR